MARGASLVSGISDEGGSQMSGLYPNRLFLFGLSSFGLQRRFGPSLELLSCWDYCRLAEQEKVRRRGSGAESRARDLRDDQGMYTRN